MRETTTTTTTTKTVIKYLFVLCYIVVGAGGLIVYYNHVAISSFCSSYSAGTATINSGSSKQKNDSNPAIISSTTTAVTMTSSSDDSMKNDTAKTILDDNDDKTTITPVSAAIDTESSISSSSLMTFLHVGPAKTGTSSLQCTMSTLPLFSDTNSSSAFVYIGKFQTECPPSRYPRNKPFGGMKLMAPVGLVVNQSTKWSNLYQRQIHHYTSLQKHVIVSAEEYTAMSFPPTRHNEPHWNLLQNTFWPNRTHVVATYRHSHEVLVSEYYEDNVAYKYRNKRLLSLEEYYQKNIKQKARNNAITTNNNEEDDHLYPLIYLHNLVHAYQSHSYNVTILNYHENGASDSGAAHTTTTTTTSNKTNDKDNDLLTRFFCQKRLNNTTSTSESIREAVNKSTTNSMTSSSNSIPLFPDGLCQQYKWFVQQEKLEQQQGKDNGDISNIKTSIARVSSKEMTQYNLIAQAAMNTNKRRGGLIDLLPPQAKQLFASSRKMDNVISRAIQTHVQQQLIQNTNSNITANTYLDILPVTCLSDGDLEDILRRSIINGRRTFGEDGLDEIGLRKSFEKYKIKREFCSVNVHSVLEDPKWIKFLKYDMLQYIEQQTNNTILAQ